MDKTIIRVGLGKALSIVVALFSFYGYAKGKSSSIYDVISI